MAVRFTAATSPLNVVLLLPCVVSELLLVLAGVAAAQARSSAG
jgi:hypothetical protein